MANENKKELPTEVEKQANDRSGIANLETENKSLQEKLSQVARTAQVAINQNKQLRALVKQLSELM